LVCLVATALAFLPASAAESHRTGRGEASLFFQYMAGDHATMHTENGRQVEADYDTVYGGGLGFGYNLDEHWNVNGDLSYGALDMSPTFSHHDSDVAAFTINLNMDYNILRSRVTPFLTAGVGFAYFYEYETFDCYDYDSWGVPYYYTVVIQDQSTFTLGAGAGLRWDISDHMYLKVFYRANWHTGLDDIQDDMLFHEVRVAIGCMF